MKDEAEAREHARLLREAMAAADDMNAQTLADSTGVTKRTVGNWISRNKPTLPKLSDQAKIRKVFPHYMDGAGDPVEAALRRSELIEWRQAAVLTEYKRHLHDQQREAAG